MAKLNLTLEDDEIKKELKMRALFLGLSVSDYLLACHKYITDEEVDILRYIGFFKPVIKEVVEGDDEPF